MIKNVIVYGSCMFLFWSCNNSDHSPDSETDIPVNNIPAPSPVSYSVQNIYPHDTSAITQGLEYYNN